jgi:membrane fusion protein (multidrug efflux system)
VIFPDEQIVLAVPATAILSAPYGDSVYVIEPHPGKNGGKPEAVVSQKFVRTGRSHGDFISILSGLKAGDRVVSAGVFKLRNGMSVQENNDLVPKAVEKPSPSDS